MTRRIGRANRSSTSLLTHIDPGPAAEPELA
jgi:hypothetical protein